MKPSQVALALGLVFAAVCAVASPAVMIALGGIGICGGMRLTFSTVGVSLLLAAGLPALSGVFLRRWWPVATLAFSWALLMILLMMIMMAASVEWDRATAILGCIAMACLSAWAGNKLGTQQAAGFPDDESIH